MARSPPQRSLCAVGGLGREKKMCCRGAGVGLVRKKKRARGARWEGEGAGRIKVGR